MNPRAKKYAKRTSMVLFVLVTLLQARVYRSLGWSIDLSYYMALVFGVLPAAFGAIAGGLTGWGVDLLVRRARKGYVPASVPPTATRY